MHVLTFIIIFFNTNKDTTILMANLQINSKIIAEANLTFMLTEVTP